jgi:hypothetical protein
MRKHLAAAVCTALLALTVPASAEAATPARHCVVDLAQEGATSCYRTFTEAIAVATKGRVKDAPADSEDARRNAGFQAKLGESTQKQSTQSTATARQQLGGIVIGVEYYHIGYAGGTYTFTGDSTCTTETWDLEYEFDLWGNWTWNDEISSFHTYGNCWVDHFDLPQYQGAHLGYQPSQYYIGDTMNDRTTSLRWS